MNTPDKQQIRDTILTHLSTLSSFGIQHILRTKENAIKSIENKPVVDEALVVPDHSSFDEDRLKQHTTLGALHHEITGCQKCRLCEQRTNLVFGDGNPEAKLMFVGEGPGQEEDKQGLPFVGAAGQLLTKIIEAMKLKRQDVYITNIVKCRPPNNRNPLEDEITICIPVLKQQIQIIKPKIIMCLGKFAAQTLLNTQIPISRIRGTFKEVDGILIMPAFHPAYLLRNPAMERLMWEDCKKVMEKLEVTY